MPWLGRSLAILLVPVVSACAYTGGGDCCGEPLDPGTSRELALAQDTWRDWASDKLGAGQPGGTLVAAEAHFRPQDWSLPPSFTWVLTFPSTRAGDPQEVAQVLERACDFAAGARFMQGDDLDATLAVPGTARAVPARTSARCRSSFRGVASWLTYLTDHPLPPEVGGVQWTSSLSGRVLVTAYVRPPDATPALVRRLRSQLCGYPHGTRFGIAITAQPSPAGQMGAVRPYGPTRTCRP